MMDYQTLWIVYADRAIVRGVDSKKDAISALLRTVDENRVQDIGARRCRDRAELAKAMSKYRLIDA